MDVPDHNDPLKNLCLGVRPQLYRLVLYQTNNILEPAPALFELRDPEILKFHEPLVRGPFQKLPLGMLLLRMPLFQPDNLGLVGFSNGVHFLPALFITPQIHPIALFE